MTLIRDFAQNIKSDGDLVITGDFRGPSSITSAGDILGSNFQLSGTTSSQNSRLRSILLASAPEDDHVSHPYLLNDLGTFRPRGGTISISGLSTGVTDAGITNMFRPNARFLTFNGSDYSGTEVTITLTDIPSTLTYLSYFGIVFGAGAFKPQSAKIEVSTDGGSNWTVILNSSASDTHYHSYYGGDNNQVNAIRYTIGQPASTQIRIINLYAYNYSSLGMDGYFLPRDGGEIFGNIGLRETPSDFGTGYSLRLGNATKGGSLVLRSHDDGNSGLLQLVHKDGASAMQLGSSTDITPSPDEIYGYIYNYNNDFRIQGDNGTHVIVDGNGDVTFNGKITTTDGGADFTLANFYSNQTQANVNIGRGASERLNFYVTDSQAYIRYFQDEATTIDHSVNFQIQSSSSGPNLFKFNSYLESGDDITVSGSRILAGQYSTGHIATWGGQRSSGGPVMGYGVWPATTGGGLDFVSSSGVALERSAFILNGNNFQWWNADSSTTTLDSAVTLDLKMDLGRSGLILNAGTGLVVGSTNVTPLVGTQVYINKDGNTGINLQRWGEGDLNDASSYRFRIDQNFKFIANDGTSDTVTINSSTGNIEFANGSGLDFNVAQSTASGTTPSSAILDDYEEGTWTPSFRNDSTEMGYGTPSYIGGNYIKVGNLVTIHFGVLFNGTLTGTGTGELRIYGLPFTNVLNVGPYREPSQSMLLGNQTTASDSYQFYGFINNSGFIGTRLLDGADTTYRTNRLTNNTFIKGTLQYFVA